MNGKSMMMLVLAIVLGLGAMVATRKVLSKPSAPQEETQEILVAARDFKEEELITAEMVKSVRMAKSAIPAGAFASYKEIEDRWVKTTLMENDPVVEKRLGPKGTPPGLVAKIPKGMRAFAVEVNEQSGVSGFILPGHHVDVVRFDSNERAHNARGETILQNVLVLATGQVFTRADEKAVQSRTVTLALEPEQVDTVVAAKARGPLSLALRGVNDHDIVERQPPKPVVDEAAAKAQAAAQAAAAKAQQDAAKAQEAARAQTEKLQKEVAELKQALAKKLAEPPPAAPKPKAAPKPVEQRWVHIYRPLHQRREEDRKRGEYPEKIAVNEEARKVVEVEKQRVKADEPRGLGFGATSVAGAEAGDQGEPSGDH